MYCRITYRWAFDKRLTGDFVQGGGALNLGQTPTCDLRLPGYSGFSPEVFATVLPSSDGGEWNLVRRSDFIDMSVGGKRVEIACALHDGDELVFSYGNERLAVLRFEECEGVEGGVVHGHRKSAQVWFSTVMGIAAVFIACFALTRNDNLLGHDDMRACEESVFQIVADSVYLVETVGGKETVLEAAALEKIEKGTCFLTDEGLIVTARHCIEPWINESLSLDMALWAETMNRELGEERYSVRSHCIVSCGNERREFMSSDFRMNRSRDMFISLGDGGNTVYMRTIVPIALRRDMELGDFAYVETDMGGGIPLASVEEMKAWEEDERREIVVVGYPLNDNMTDRRNVIEGLCQDLEWKYDGSSLEGCFQVSAGVSHGYSGGPVLARVKGAGKDRLMVIGIVSKYDTHAENSSFWAVPSLEVLNLRSQGGEIMDDTFMYRR